MNRKQEEKALERWFDGESGASAEMEERMASSPEMARHAAFLKTVRSGAETIKDAPEIRDEQFDTFMHGIRNDIHQRPTGFGFRNLWAVASVVTAAIVVAISTLVIFSEGPNEVSARTEIEAISTELEGATVDVETSEDGQTVWIKVTPEDLW